MGSTLYRNGVVHSRTDPFAEAVLVVDGQVAWLGAESTIHTVVDGADEVVDVDGALIAPAFVDAHTHLVPVGRAELAAGRSAPGTDHVGAERWDLAGSDAMHEVYAAALYAAASAGIVAVHEQSNPEDDDRAGLAAVIAGTSGESCGWPAVLGYRAERCETVDDARAILGDVPGLVGLGALHLDGELVDRTAALRFDYADAAGSKGELLLGAEQVANHTAAATRAGVQAGFHVVGDRALHEALLGIQVAAEIEGMGAVRGVGHRLEHAPMTDASALASMILLGLSVVAQPHRALEGSGPGGWQSQRLGAMRAEALVPLADLAGAGVPLALGSASPESAFDPWGAVRAAVLHTDPGQRVSARAAFRAHTRGGWRAAHLDGTGAGEIRLGAPAHLAIWRAESLVVQAPDGRLAAWSTDPRAGTPLLPELGHDIPRPVCVRTLRAGKVIFDTLG
ncbi:amidohydrolase family protein [Actinotalea sp.]|uniref:amidohydrolase family protein n=1 Tax=Actinotalea sp. TaxID=1872145 RepID=UPI003562FFAF